MVAVASSLAFSVPIFCSAFRGADLSPTPAENLPSIWEPRVQPRRRGAVPPFPLFSETQETRVEGTFPSVLLLGHGTANEQPVTML